MALVRLVRGNSARVISLEIKQRGKPA